MKLSNAFEQYEERTNLELVCMVYNINSQYNAELKEWLKVINGYCDFVDKTREYYAEGVTLGEAVDKSICECIENYILEDFSSKGESW